MASTAGTSGIGSPPGVLDEITQFFSWNPPLLVPGHKLSSKTCPPSFYDKHFTEALVLKRVKRLPSLIQDLAGNVDQLLNAASNTLPPLLGFPTAQRRKADLRNLNVTMQNEKAVANFYQQTTATYCSIVASTLALHPNASFSEWQSLLSWTQSGCSSAYAIMDGQLCFIEEGFGENKTSRADIVLTMDIRARRIFEDLRASETPLATWKFKNIIAGSVEVITAVPNLGKFAWTYCFARECGEVASHDRARKRVNRVRIGPDAQAPPWTLPDSQGSWDEEIEIHPPVPHMDASSLLWSITPQVIQSASGSGPLSLSPAPPISSPFTSLTDEESSGPTKDKWRKRKRGEDEDEDEDNPPAKDNGKKRKQGEDQPPAKVKGKKRKQGEAKPPAKDKGKKRGEDEDESKDRPPAKDTGKKRRQDDDNNDDEDDAYQDHYDVSAQSLVQQAWAQAVRVDGSVIILHSGNHELVCIRHRATQTLYVSDLIEPHKCSNPGYGKLQVGVYAAAIQDAIDRRELRPAQSTSSGDGSYSSGGFDDNRGSGSGWKDGHGNYGHERQHGYGPKMEGSSGLQGSGGSGLADELEGIEKMMDIVSNCDVVHLYLRYDVYDSPIPASFFRSAPSIMPQTRLSTPLFSPGTNHTHRPEECMTVVLTSDIVHGATGVVHRGTLEPEICDGAMSLDIVVKLAFDTEQRCTLRNEYEVYRQLRSRGVQRGITTTLGLFDDFEGAACALIMPYAGVALSAELQRNLSISDCKSALSTLESIHLAGILHGDIRRENILFGDAGVTIIDFGHSKQCNNQRAQARELGKLCYVLGLEGGGHSGIVHSY